MAHKHASPTQRTAPSVRTPNPQKRSPGVLSWILQIFGELAITVGLVLLLFVAWQLWWTNLEADSTQQHAVDSLSQEFKAQAQKEKDSDAKPSGNSADKTEKNWDPNNPPAIDEPAYGQAFGIAYIPRFGPTYQRPIAEGTGTDVLDTLGLGHYEKTAMPGQIGNFALAGHRQTNGAVLDAIEEIQNGDHIYVQTAQGYYTYTVYETKIVLPTDVNVIAPNPANPSAKPIERLLTLTTCHPRYGDKQRYIVHAKMESWQPLSAGAPEEIKTAVGE